jgi:hypothetical protein
MILGTLVDVVHLAIFFANALLIGNEQVIKLARMGKINFFTVDLC